MLTKLSRNSHPRHWTEMIVVSTLWPIYIRRMSPQYPFCRKFCGSQRQSGYNGGNDSSFARLKLNLVSISSPFTVLPELPWRFLLKFLHLHFVFAKLNKSMLLRSCLVTATTRIFLSTSCFLYAIYLQSPKSILLHFSLFSYTILLLSHASFVSLSVHLSLLSRSFQPTNYDLRCFGTTTIYDPPVEAVAMSQQTVFRVYTQAAKQSSLISPFDIQSIMATTRTIQFII
jgi:hypothetical protein